MNAIEEKDSIIEQLCNDVGKLFDTIHKIDLKRYNSQAKYIWKIVYTGYGDRITIFKRLGLFKKTIVVYDIEDKSCFEHIVESEDSTIFEVIEEANTWINGELDLMRKRINSFRDKYIQHACAINENIKVYEELSKCLEG